MKTPIKELENIIKSISYRIIAKSVYVLQNGNIKIHTCNTSYANIGMTTVEGYKIVDFLLNEYVTIQVPQGVVIEVDDYITLPTPDFYAGKFKRVQEQIKKNNLIGVKPYVWVFELMNSQKDLKWDSNLQEVAKVRLFVLGSNKSQNSPETNRGDVIETLQNGIVNPMFDYINENKDKFQRLNTVDQTDHETFTTKGNAISGGAEMTVFGNNNSAIELKLDLKIKKDYICC